MKSWFGQTKYMFSSKILAWEYFVYFKIRTTQIVVCNILFFPLKNENEAPFLQALFKPCFTVKAWKSQKTVDSGYIWLVSQLCTCSFQYTFLNYLVFFFFVFFFKDLAYLGLPVFFLLTLLFTFKERNILKSMWIFFFFSCDFSGISELV